MSGCNAPNASDCVAAGAGRHFSQRHAIIQHRHGDGDGDYLAVAIALAHERRDAVPCPRQLHEGAPVAAATRVRATHTSSTRCSA